MRQPQQHPPEPQQIQADLATAATRPGQHHLVQPDPDIPQDQGDPHVEQPQRRIACRGPNPGLMQLSIGRLDGEPLAIRLPDPVEGWRLKSPEGVDQVLLAMPTPLTTIVAAFDTDRDAGRPLLGIVQGVIRFPAISCAP